MRHNEDQLNSQLAQQLPLQVQPHSYDSAHTKAHLLLQAHFSHAQLPCSDYTTDTKTVLDSAIRICQVAPGDRMPHTHTHTLVLTLFWLPRRCWTLLPTRAGW